jgi:hypothetical protein
MNPHTKSIFGVFPNLEGAKRALADLEAHGFTHQDISLLVHAENRDKDALAPEKHTESPRGMAAGATAGGVIGGSLGLLSGLGALVFPGVGPLLAFGPILGALTGAGMGGAAGGVVGTFIGVGIPKHKADYLQDVVKKGGILVSVHVEEIKLRSFAHDILKKAGAEDISSSMHGSVSSVDDISPGFADRQI